MTSFNERENAFEIEFAHREELKFKVRERAVASLALWAAQRLGKPGGAAATYAREIVALDIENQGPDATLDRVMEDLRSAGVTQQEVRRAMTEFLAQAETSVRGDA